VRISASIITAAGLVLLGAGCASSARAIVEQRDPIALVSVASNWDIPWKGEEATNPNALIIIGSSALRNDPDMTLVSNADSLIDTAETLFRENIDSTNPISLADKETVLSSRAYREARTNEPARNNRSTPDGYRYVNYRDKAFPAALAGETGVSRVMFVVFDFSKSMYSGLGKNGECRANVDMNVIILDNGGKILYNRTFSSWSSSKIKVSGGVYSQTGLMQLFEEAINEACAMFLESF